MTLDPTSYSLFAVLAGLTLLMGADHASPGCTGPAVQQCDYIEVAKAANSRPNDRPFNPGRGFNVFDQGSSVYVQQSFPEEAYVHASAVRIDKKSCRPCEVIFYGHLPPPLLEGELPRGKLIQTRPPKDSKEAEAIRADYRKWGIPFKLDQGTPAEVNGAD